MLYRGWRAKIRSIPPPRAAMSSRHQVKPQSDRSALGILFLVNNSVIAQGLREKLAYNVTYFSARALLQVFKPAPFMRVFSKKSCLPFMRNGVRCFWGVPLGSLVLSHECTLRKTVKKQSERMKNRKSWSFQGVCENVINTLRFFFFQYVCCF